MTNRMVNIIMLMMGCGVVILAWLAVQQLTAGGLYFVFPLLLAVPLVAAVVTSRRYLARWGQTPISDRPAQLFATNRQSYAMQPMIVGRTLTWRGPASAPWHRWFDFSHLDLALYEQEKMVAHLHITLPEFRAASATIRFGDTNQAFNWQKSVLLVTEAASPLPVAAYQPLAYFAGQLTTDQGTYLYDGERGVFFDGSGTPLVQSRFIHQGRVYESTIEVRVTLAGEALADLPLLIGTGAFLATQQTKRRGS